MKNISTPQIAAAMLFVLLAACGDEYTPPPLLTCHIYQDGRQVATAQAHYAVAETRGIGAPCIRATRIVGRGHFENSAVVCGAEIAIACGADIVEASEP